MTITSKRLPDEFTDRQPTAEAARDFTRQLINLNEISLAITSTLDLDTVLSTLLSRLCEVLATEAASVALIDHDSAELVFRQATGPVTSAVIGKRIPLGHSIAGRVAANGQSVLVPDTAVDPRFNDSLDGASGFHTRNVVCVPLVTRAGILGVVYLINKRHGPFDDDDLRLLQSVAGQAAIAIQNADAYQAEQKASLLAQKLSETALTLSGNLNLDELLKRIWAQLRQVIACDSGTIFLLEDGRLRVRSTVGFPSDAHVEAVVIDADSDFLFQEIVRTGEVVLLADAQQDSRFRGYAGTQTVRSWLGMPLYAQGVLIGFMTLDKHEPHFYCAQDAKVAQAFAAQAASAIFTAQLYAQAQRRTEQLATITEMGWAVSILQKQHRVVDVIEIIYRQLQHIVPVDGFYICLYDPKLDELSFPLVYDLGLCYEEPAIPLRPDSAVAQVLRTGRPVKVLRAAEEAPAVAEDGLGNRMTSYASSLYIPLRSSVGAFGVQVFGVLAVHSYTLNAYAGEHAEILNGIEPQIAIAIKNAQLYEQTQQRATQLATMNEIGRAVSTLRDLDDVLETIRQQVQRCLPFDGFGIGLYDAATNQIAFPLVYDEGVRKDESAARPLIDSSFSYRVIQSGQPLRVNRLAEDPAVQPPGMISDKSRSTGALLFAPLPAGDQILGMISVQSHTPNVYTNDDLDLLVGIAYQAAIAIQNARLYSAAQQEIAERARAEAEVRRHRDHLEELVDERVAEIKHINAELQQQNAELDAFAHTVAHDLKNPLGPLMGFAEILLEELRDTPDEVAQDCANHLLTASRKMARIIDELLLLASVRRQDEVRLEELDMAAIVHEVQERIDYLAREYDAEIHLPRVWPRAIGHAAWIEEVWTNYLSNAIKYGGRPPRIELGATVLEHTGMARFWVRDNGAGLKPEDQARLFTEFTQLHQLRAQGHGLGLSIVRRIIERLGGQVGVESAPDHGSAFFFTLPMA